MALNNMRTIVSSVLQLFRSGPGKMIGVLVAGLLATVLMSVSVHAQYREPNNSPPGGRSGVWIDTSATAQIKTGSLLIGDQAGADVLCLNGSNLTDLADCIPDWPTLRGATTDGYVRVYYKPFTDYVPGGSSIVPAEYQPLEQRGYAYLRGTGTDPIHTVGADTNVIAATAIGVFAGDGSDGVPVGANFAGYAAYFSGRVRVEVDGVGNPGTLCLNSTSPYQQGVNSGYGCISDWNELAASVINPYVKVQLANPPTELQFGTGWIGRTGGARDGTWVFQQGVVVGGVSNNIAAGTYLGDGLCSPEIGENLPDPDCNPAAPSPQPEPEAASGVEDSIVPPF